MGSKLLSYEQLTRQSIERTSVVFEETQEKAAEKDEPETEFIEKGSFQEDISNG